MAFLVTAEVITKEGDKGKAWWVSHGPLTTDTLFASIARAKKRDNLVNVIPIYICEMED